MGLSSVEGPYASFDETADGSGAMNALDEATSRMDSRYVYIIVVCLCFFPEIRQKYIELEMVMAQIYEVEARAMPEFAEQK